MTDKAKDTNQGNEKKPAPKPATKRTMGGGQQVSDAIGAVIQSRRNFHHIPKDDE